MSGASASGDTGCNGGGGGLFSIWRVQHLHNVYPNCLTFELEPHGKNHLLQSDWTDSHLVRGIDLESTLKFVAQNEHQQCTHK